MSYKGKIAVIAVALAMTLALTSSSVAGVSWKGLTWEAAANTAVSVVGGNLRVEVTSGDFGYAYANTALGLNWQTASWIETGDGGYEYPGYVHGKPTGMLESVLSGLCPLENGVGQVDDRRGMGTTPDGWNFWIYKEFTGSPYSNATWLGARSIGLHTAEMEIRADKTVRYAWDGVDKEVETWWQSWEILPKITETRLITRPFAGTTGYVDYTDYSFGPAPSSLTGQITLSDYGSTSDLSIVPIKIELIENGSVARTEEVKITTNPGQYTIQDVVPGIYDVAFKACSWLRTIVPGVGVPSGGGQGTASAVLISGDVDGDNAVTTTDLSATLKNAEQVVVGGDGKVQSRSRNGVTWGIASGHPFIENERATFTFALPENGAGLISIYDKERSREFLQPGPGNALLWEVLVKRNGGGNSYSNASLPCQVTVTSDGLEFSWTGDLSARVRACVPPGDSLLRMWLNASPNLAADGLTTVVFPKIGGILPISTGASNDVMLDTWGPGDLRSSPLLSGTALQMSYPNCMQFTGMYADGEGLYLAEEDGDANQKSLTWSPGTSALDFNISHPVLGWGGASLVKNYASPGDVVVGPFHGDWYDAAQLYRKWAITAPWCSGGPIYQRADFPRWLGGLLPIDPVVANRRGTPYWTIGDLGNDSGVDMENRKFDFFNLPVGICHAYGYYFPQHQDDRYPEMLPPKLGSVGLRNVLTELRGKGMKSVAYVNGTMWDMDTESYGVENAATNAARTLSNGATVTTTGYGGQNHALMCPASPLWRTKMTDLSKQLVGNLGFDGVYYDFCNVQIGDCYNQQHGHSIAGGNYWMKSVRDMYAQIRPELKTINPDVVMAGESNSEYVIGVLDATLGGGVVDTKAPLYLAVYHGYTLVYGGYGVTESFIDASRMGVGRWWLFGGQNGWNNMEHVMARGDAEYSGLGPYYYNLLHCDYYFAYPYLTYGRMLRPPTITGYNPIVTAHIGSTPFSAHAIEGSAWQAPDGTVGIFFLNYGTSDLPREFTWSVDLAEGAGWGVGQQINIYQWTTEAAGEQFVEQVTGGTLTKTATIGSGGLIALKLEVVQ